MVPYADLLRSWRLEIVLGALSFAILIGHGLSAPYLGMSIEDIYWEGFFRHLSPAGIFCEPHGSYRPLCGLLLHLQSPWSATTKHFTSVGLHVAAAALTAGLGQRLGGGRAAFWSGAAMLLWSSQAEVVSWLGGRCELVWVIPGLLGAHTVLSGLNSPRRPWTVATAVLCAMSALGKEPGFLLPAAYLPLLHGRTAREHARELGPAVITLAGILAVRTTLMSGLGEYVGDRALRSPVEWAGNLAHGYTKLALGSTWRWPNEVAVVVPVVGAALLLWGTRRLDRGFRTRCAIALAVMMMPTALVHAPRVLYGSVALGAIATGCGIARWPTLRFGAAAILLAHGAATLLAQHLWITVTERRRATIAQIETIASETGQTRAVLLGLRWRPAGTFAGLIHRSDFAPPLVVDGLLDEVYSTNGRAPLRPAVLERTGECVAVLLYSMPKGAPRYPPDVTWELEGDRLVLRFENETLLFWGDFRGRLRHAVVSCRDSNAPNSSDSSPSRR